MSDYTNGWAKLPGVKTDVEVVSRALEKNGFEVEVVEDPTLDELEIAIEDFIFEKGADPENRLLIYYAGHGHTKTLGYGGEMGYLVPADAPLPKKGRDIAFQRKVMSMQQIEVFAKNTSAKHVLFMFDSCFAGSVFLATRAAPSYIEVFTEEPVRQFITSGSADQEVPDNSIFRRAFVDALEGSADFDKDGYLTGSELGTYIQKRTAEDWKGDLTPQYGKLQDPNLNKGDFVFELSKSPVVEEPPTPEPAPVKPEMDLAAQAWSMIENSENPKAFELFLKEFPESAQASLAKLKLMLLPPPDMAKKQDETIPESYNELAEEKPFAPVAEPKVFESLIGEAAKEKLFRDNECVGCDLNGTSLSGIILRGANLKKASLRGADLRGTDLYEAKLREADLRGADLQRADLHGADLSNAEMRYADLNKANIKGANLINTKFCNTTMPDGSIANRDCYPAQQETNQSSKLHSGEAAKKKLLETKECVGCDLQGVVLRGANLAKASLAGVILYNADLRYSDLGTANLSKADLRKATLCGADLRGANLRGVDLREARLISANLRHADLSGANLTDARNANSSGAKFCNTTMPNGSIANRDCYAAQADTNQRSEVLSGEAAQKKLVETNECIGCDLNGADLYAALLSNADLSGTDLSGTNLHRASLRDANLSGANLSGAYLWNADLGNANLAGANLSAANLLGANLLGANLLGANLLGANLRVANLNNAKLYSPKFNQPNLSKADLLEAALDSAKFCNTTMPDGSINNDDC